MLANCNELEMELAIHQKLQQFRRCGVETPNFSGVRHEVAYRIIKELHEKNGWPVYKLCAAVGVSLAGILQVVQPASKFKASG